MEFGALEKPQAREETGRPEVDWKRFFSWVLNEIC
jgi:hypothetical protein